MKSKSSKSRKRSLRRRRKPFFQKGTVDHPAFFQPKLKVDAPNSPAEKEADQIADQVVKNDVQRQAEEEEMAQTKLNIQRQEEEEEAMQTKLNIQRQEEEEEMAQPKLDIQRQAEEEEEMAQTKLNTTLQRAEPDHKGKDGTPRVPDHFESLLAGTKGKGFPLPDDIRNEMESKVNASFEKVRIHTHSDAVKLCKMINAQAFTRGYDIYFDQGRYEPHTSTGKHLLAHELTHVVQQKGSH